MEKPEIITNEVTGISTITIPKDYTYKVEENKVTVVPIKKVRTYKDLYDTPIKGFYIDEMSNVYPYTGKASARNINIFLTKEHAKAAMAMAIISQLMPYYGGAVTWEEWNKPDVPKYVICANDFEYTTEVSYSTYFYLAFHTEKQCNEFFENNSQLIKDYFMLT